MTAEPGRGPSSSTLRCGVLGSPIAHSLSPTLHRAAYAELGLDWTYDRFEVQEFDLASFVAGLDESWRGLSLTMPLKTAVLGLGSLDDTAQLVGAANTLILDPAGNRVYNTDVGGLVAAVRWRSGAVVDRVTLLGAGATARSAMVSAAELGVSRVAVLARTPDRAASLVELGDSIGVNVSVHPWAADDVPEADLLISTVPSNAVVPLVTAAATSAPVVFDAIYDPWPTPLALAAERSGRTVVSGLDLLVHQAVLQIALMTGHQVSPEILYAALPARLGVAG